MSETDKPQEKEDGLGKKLVRLADKLTQRVMRAADDVEKSFDSAADAVTPKILKKPKKQDEESS